MAPITLFFDEVDGQAPAEYLLTLTEPVQFHICSTHGQVDRRLEPGSWKIWQKYDAAEDDWQVCFQKGKVIYERIGIT